MPEPWADTVSTHNSVLLGKTGYVNVGWGTRDAYCRQWRNHPWDRYLQLWFTRRVVFVLWSDRQGKVYRGRVVRPMRDDVQSVKSAVAEVIWGVDAMRRKKVDEVKRRQELASPAGLKDTHKRLAEWLTSGWFEDTKEARIGPTITFWCVSGEWRAALKDRAESLVLWLSAPTFSELMEMADAMCQSSEASWRHDEQGGLDKGKRVKTPRQ